MGGRDGQFSSNLFLLFRAAVGSIARRVLVVKSSRSLCTVRRLFPTPGDALHAPLLLESKITPVTFRRRINSYIVGINEVSLQRHEITPELVVSFCSSLNTVAHLYLTILPSILCFVVLMMPKRLS